MKTNISISSLDAARALTEQFITWLNVDKNQDFHLAISGGSTPMILFQLWKDLYFDKIDWKRLQIYWVDERCVAPDDAESNYGMTKKILLDLAPIAPDQIHRVWGENAPDAEQIRYAAEVNATVPTTNGFPSFDLILLGMGDDGHTASIFPHQMELLTVNEAIAVAIKPNSDQRRITLTGKTIRNAKQVVFFVTGEGKAAILKEISDDATTAQNYPSYHIAKDSTKVIFYLDQAAAKLL